MFQSYNNKLLFCILFESFIIQLGICCIFPLIQVKNIDMFDVVMCYVVSASCANFRAMCEHCRLRSSFLKKNCQDFQIFFKDFEIFLRI